MNGDRLAEDKIDGHSLEGFGLVNSKIACCGLIKIGCKMGNGF